MADLKQTPLIYKHREANAKLVDFSGWEMPIHYGSQIEEHHIVRRDAGMFDVSHMLPVDLKGEGARDFLKKLVANNVDKLQTTGKALYSCMLHEGGGVVDDLIIYFLNESWFRIVVNAGCADKFSSTNKPKSTKAHIGQHTSQTLDKTPRPMYTH